MCGQPHYPGPSDGHPCTPTLHTGGGIQANQWPQRSQQMIKVQSGPVFLFGPFLTVYSSFRMFFFFQSQPRFSEGRLGMWVSGENRSAQGGVDHGPGPCLLLFCLTEQTAVGKKTRELRNEGTHQGTVRSSPWLVGWPRRRRYTGSPFFFSPPFCFVLSEWGQQDPPTTTLPPSVIHKQPSLQHQRWISRGAGSPLRMPLRTRKRGLLPCLLPGRSAFFFYCHYRRPCKSACV